MITVLIPIFELYNKIIGNSRNTGNFSDYDNVVNLFFLIGIAY